MGSNQQSNMDLSGDRSRTENVNNENSMTIPEEMYQSNLDELTANGFGEGDSEYDSVMADLNRVRGNSQLGDSGENNTGGNSGGNTTGDTTAGDRGTPSLGQQSSGNTRSLMNNLRAHNIPTSLGSAGKMARKGIRGAAKFATKKTFKLATGVVGGAAGVGLGLATGQGLTGALTGAYAGYRATSKYGERLGNAAFNLGAGATGAIGGAVIGAKRGDGIIDGAIGGVSTLTGSQTFENVVRREIDTFSGNTSMSDDKKISDFKENKNNIDYTRDQLTQDEDHRGRVATEKEVKEKMESMNPYIEAGLSDIKDIIKAQKAEGLGLSPGSVAEIAAIAKNRGITADVLGDEKKYNAKLKDLTQEYQNKKGVPEDVAKKMADRTLNIMKAQNGQAHNLQKATSNNNDSKNIIINDTKGNVVKNSKNVNVSGSGTSTKVNVDKALESASKKIKTDKTKR